MTSCKGLIVFSLLFLLICPYTQALEAQNEKKWLTVEPMRSTPFSFELKNSNNLSTTYSLFVRGNFVWLIFPNSQITLGPGEHKTFTLIGFPDTTTTPQVYPAQIIAMSELDTITYNVVMDIPALNRPVESKYEIRSVSFDERGFRFLAYSQEPLNLSVEIDKDNLLFDNFSTLLEAGEATFEKKLSLAPGNYTARIIATKGDKIIYSDKKTYEKRFESGIRVTESTLDSILWSVTTVKITNYGNIVEKKAYDIETEQFVDPFLSSIEPFARVPNNGNIIHRWEFSLEPGQAKEFTYTYNYSYAFAIAFVVVLCTAAVVIVLRREVVVKKALMGGIKGIKSDHELRISIEIMNRTGRTIKDVSLEDYMQPLFKIKKSFAGPAPVGFYRKGDDIKIVCKIPEIAPKESRVLAYTIVPKVGLGGSYAFSRAKLTYKIGNFRRVALSNLIKLGK